MTATVTIMLIRIVIITAIRHLASGIIAGTDRTIGGFSPSLACGWILRGGVTASRSEATRTVDQAGAMAASMNIKARYNSPNTLRAPVSPENASTQLGAQGE